MNLVRRTAGALIVGGLSIVLACSGGPSSHDASGSLDSHDARGEACTALTVPPRCESPLDVATQEDAEREIGALGEYIEQSTVHAFGEALRPTRDLRFTASVELDIAPLVGNASCPASSGDADPDDCRETWTFAGEKTVEWRNLVFGPPPALPFPAGVTCSTSDCTRLAIAAGTVVRFQRAFERHVFARSYLHFVRVLRPCTEPCGADEMRCATSTTCIATSAFCLLCEGESNRQCACRVGCDAKPEDADCSYTSSDDTGGRGTCTSGSCQR